MTSNLTHTSAKQATHPTPTALYWPALALMLSAGPVRALPTQAFQVSASVVAGCQVQGGGVLGTLDFGTRSAIGGPLAVAAFTQNSAVSIACTPGTTLNMSIDGGSHYTTTRNLRRSNGLDKVAYRLFTSPAYTAASEIPVNQNVTVSFNNAANITLPVYGLVRLNGFQRAGTYTDVLSVTLSW